ncbi:MAG: peptidoglycan DD-metalloendopeptidase family protein [Acinetobacter sp.]
MQLLQQHLVKKQASLNMLKPLFLSIAAISSVVLTGCASKPQVSGPTHTLKAPNYYTVRSGDTLSSIAARYGLNYLTIAQMNGIAPPYVIYVNQSLKLKGGANVSSAVAQPMQNSTPIQSQHIPIQNNTSTQTVAPPANVEPAPSVANTNSGSSLQWVKPSNGAVIANFNMANNIKGIRYSGQLGDPIVAAADGQVVYADNGLKEYGNLVLIKHSNGYISAYAHNSKMFVKSGSNVTAGQKIAEMGSSGTNQVMLEFQIRADGKPIDPLQVIPR